MPVNVRKITLWRAEVANKPGMLAETLGPLAEAEIDLQVVMGYRYPGKESKAAIEVAPITRKKAAKAAEAAGMEAMPMPTLMVEGNNRPGLGHSIARAISEASINLTFLMAQVVGKRYSAIVGCENDEDAKKVAALIRRATGGKRK
ncbi:MAG: hypothetical protein GY953_46990 [bacterium]|nr:hypothetical protein [bacterium]